MEIEDALLEPMIRLINDQETTYKKDRHALFFFRKNPFDEELDTLHRHLFLNDAVAEYGDHPERVTDELEKFKNDVRTQYESKVINYDCVFKQDGANTPELKIPELKGEEKKQNDDLCKGRLTDFSIHKSCLKTKILNQLRQEYPDVLSSESIELKYVVIAGMMVEILDEYADRKTPVTEQKNDMNRIWNSRNCLSGK
jgi:hypothetical protein